MKKTILFMLIIWATTAALLAQPNWLDFNKRKAGYPNNVFFTGFDTDYRLPGETQNDAIARVVKKAQGYIAEAVRVQVSVETDLRVSSVKKNESEEFSSVYDKAVKTSSTIELVGIETESYVDSKEGTIYGFAYVNKYELMGFYKASFSMNIKQLESVLNTAKQLEAGGEKPKARTQYQEAVLLLYKVEQAQDVLIALDPKTNIEREKTVQYRNDINLALARLAQGVYIYFESREDMFGKNSTLVSNKVKSILSTNGCSFTPEIGQADFILKLTANARKHGDTGQIVFCYADVEVELIKNLTQKTVYQEELKHKGGHTTYENAAREAFNEVGKMIAEKLLKWVKE